MVGKEVWIGGCYLVGGEKEIGSFGRVGRGVSCPNMDVE